ncbi:MAG: hypothetical protein CM1200mP18_23610 [Gammaproteobacteria bacterium]|nr:MAG: hypothetical protein CM1200mP18_23610 [Gammaproteobacteria bacterium]
MLGVHSLAYGLIGGLGTVLGPLIGVAIDIGFLESTRDLPRLPMIVFGGLVAVMLIFMPAEYSMKHVFTGSRLLYGVVQCLSYDLSARYLVS